MNKKILALAMVPLLIGLSGAVAFSQFTGSDNKVINATAGTLQFTESAEITSVAMDPSSMLSVAGPSATYGAGGTPFSGGAMDLGSMVSSSGTNTMTYTISASGLAPGDWFAVQFTLANTGSVPFLATVPGGGATVSVNPNSLSSQAAALTQFPSGSDATGSTWLYLDNTATAFGSGLFMPTSGGSSVVTFNVYIGLGNNAGNSYEGSTFTYSLTITVSTT